MASAATPERADAARNRRKVLAAAEELFTARGVAAVSMDDVAAAAGVGKGTLYRRFGDKSGLAAALLDEREAQLQQDMLGGPPPLGPGAAPVERLAAFVDAYLGFVVAHLDLVAMSQTASPGARLRTGSHRLWVHHCRLLLAEAGAPDAGPAGRRPAGRARRRAGAALAPRRGARRRHRPRRPRASGPRARGRV